MKIVESTLLTPITVSIVCIAIVVSMTTFDKFYQGIKEKHEIVTEIYSENISKEIRIFDKAKEVVKE